MTPLPPTRRGACPGLSTPMQTGDGLIARLSPINNALSADQLQRIAALSSVHGNGLLEITNRGNLQFRGLSAQSAPLLAQDIAQAGITASSGIAIDISPLAGLDDTETRDARPLAAAIRTALERASWHASLAPKVSIVIDGGGAVSLSDLIADLRLVAFGGASDVAVHAAPSEIGNGTAEAERGWLLYVGGCETDARCLGLLRDDADAAAAMLALLQCLAAKGNAARGRDLTNSDFTCLDRSALQPAPHLTDRLPARQPARSRGALIGTMALRGDAVVVGFGLAFGTVTAPVLADFAATAARAGDERQQRDQIRLAPGKALLVLARDRASAKALQNSAAQLGLIAKPDDPRLRLVTCSGAPVCASAHLNTHQLAHDILAQCAEQLASEPNAPPPAGKIHISGCEKCCARPGHAIIDIIASPQGAQIIRGGALQADHVPDSDIPGAVAHHLDLVRSRPPASTNTSHTSPRTTRP